MGSSPTSGTIKTGRGYFRTPLINLEPNLRAYVIGLSMGDGNLSNPNGRATRLRITCDLKYPKLIESIKNSLEKLLPENKVSVLKRKANAVDVYCYSNHLENLLGWRAEAGSKSMQNIRIPNWIKENKEYSIECLRGLFQTDGSIYLDRGYKMVNFTTIIEDLATDVMIMIRRIGFNPKVYKISTIKNPKYVIRISQRAEDFISLINLIKD